MSENWNSYFCNVNDKLASIALDLGLSKEVPIESKPWLFWIWVYMKSPRPDGLSDNSEFDVLVAIEDELAKQLKTACEAIEIGRITTDGRREFYFYGGSAVGFENAAQKALRGFKGYKFDLGTKEDPEWSQYLNVLYPSEEDMQKIMNREVLENLRKYGDTLSPVRDVHHWIYFRMPEDRERYASEARELAYQIEKRIERENEERSFGLIITRDQSVTPKEIDEAVLELFRLAKEMDAEYDGWEAQVISTKN